MIDDDDATALVCQTLVWLMRSLRWLVAAMGLSSSVTLASDDTNIYARLDEENGGAGMIRERFDETTGHMALDLAPLAWPVDLPGGRRAHLPSSAASASVSLQVAIRRADLRFAAATGATWTVDDDRHPALLALSRAASHALTSTTHPLSRALLADRAAILAYARLWDAIVLGAAAAGSQVRVVTTGLGRGEDEDDEPAAALIIHEKKNDGEEGDARARLWLDQLAWPVGDHARILAPGGHRVLQLDSYALGRGMSQPVFASDVAADKARLLRVLAAASHFAGVFILVTNEAAATLMSGGIPTAPPPTTILVRRHPDDKDYLINPFA